MQQAQIATAPSAASSATGPPLSAATTFWLAAIATTTGMYMAPQKVTPASDSLGSQPRRCSQMRSAMSSSIAMPTPPTLVLTPIAAPSRSPRNRPARWQNASRAVP